MKNGVEENTGLNDNWFFGFVATVIIGLCVVVLVAQKEINELRVIEVKYSEQMQMNFELQRKLEKYVSGEGE